jgi:aspartate kinase
MRADATMLFHVARALGESGLVPDLVISTEVALSMVLPESANPALLERQLGASMEIAVEPQRAIVCVIGGGLAREEKFRATVLAALAELDPEAVAWGVSPASLAAVLPGDRLEEAVRVLHRRFFEEGAEP